MGIEQFRVQIEEAKRRAAEAEDEQVADRYRQHADLLESVESMLSAQQRLIDRKNESLEALTGLLLTFHGQYGEELDGEAADQLDLIAEAARDVKQSIENEQKTVD
ncbi:hypothetical protein L593_08065 [Salinarchaeum sp. Harcht-Bsk1]|uniref:hypothetical protein n=1 Tax=Salinarchaeum sp. Harcht-Bsk1 TaxID=1333523 RepID=UPI000342483C|nr:hypothetical protein [Salinarchaeum sp. Harcht-Bsk1]AGN01558.1 hypothetical protein L593_08065 [Salinarchaeum sp. Harcht-Bsk1]